MANFYQSEFFHDSSDQLLLYQDFEKFLNKHYSFSGLSHDANIILGMCFRLDATGRSSIADRNLNRFINNGFRCPILVRDLVKTFAVALGSRKKNLVLLRSRSASSTFDGLLREEARLSGFYPIGTVFFRSDIFGLIRYTLRYTFFYDLLERATVTSKLLRDLRIDSTTKLFELLGCSKFLTAFNNAVETDVNYLYMLATKLGVKGVVLHSDQTFFGAMVTLAMKRAKIKTCVIAHGLFKHRLFLSILPLHADRLFVWAESNRVAVSSVLKSNQVDVLCTLKVGSISVKPNGQSKILIVGSPFYLFEERGSLDDVLNVFLTIRTKFPESKICFAPHPSESLPLRVNDFLKGCGVVISRGDIYKEASDCLLVLGGASSFLFECRASGLRAVQLAELCVEPHFEMLDGVLRMSISEFNNHQFSDTSVDLGRVETSDIKKLVGFFESDAE